MYTQLNMPLWMTAMLVYIHNHVIFKQEYRRTGITNSPKIVSRCFCWMNAFIDCDAQRYVLHAWQLLWGIQLYIPLKISCIPRDISVTLLAQQIWDNHPMLYQRRICGTTIAEGEGYLVVPKTHTKHLEREPFLAAAVQWNTLPDKFLENNTLSQFKSDMKTHLFTTAFH